MRLPGFFGLMRLAPEDVLPALALVRELIAEAGDSFLQSCGKQIMELPEQRRETVAQIRALLPKALEQAAARGLGIVAFNGQP